MELLKQYLQLQQQIHNYFNYKEDWVVIPLADHTTYHWMLIENPDNTGKGTIAYSPDPFTTETIQTGKTTYSAKIYTQRHLPKWVYRTTHHTTISADTQTDGNKLLMIFDNQKECTDNKLKEQYHKHWL